MLAVNIIFIKNYAGSYVTIRESFQIMLPGVGIVVGGIFKCLGATYIHKCFCSFVREASVKQRLSILDIVLKWISILVKKDDFTSDNIDEEFILLLTRVWCTIFLCSLGNLKLCQKVKKVNSINLN